MIALTIILGVIALLCAHVAGLTQSWPGTAATAGVVLMLAIPAVPGAWWLFDSLDGWLTALALWAITSALYHKLLCAPTLIVTGQRRPTPIIELKRRHVYGWQFGRYSVGVAVGVTA